MDENTTDIQPEDQEAQLMAALSHAMILFPLFGVMGAIIIWAAQRERSRFVSFQSLQAIVYQFVFWFLTSTFIGCFSCSTFAFPLLATGLAFSSDDPSVGAPFLGLLGFIPIILMGFILLILILLIVYGLYGAIRAYQGEAFKYIWVGNLVEKRM
jgi:uncharacterized Tic20 family protein